jgi:uncharacterized protein (TIGR03083 family)
MAAIAWQARTWEWLHMGASPWPMIHAERESLADDLDGLGDEKWQTPSLCSGWSVRDVLGHMTATARMTPPKFFLELAGSGFNFNAMTAKDVRRETTGPPADGLAAFRGLMSATTHPPGPVDSMLGEALIHAEDIRRPLFIVREYPAASVTRAADFFKGSNLLTGAKKRISGLRLQATDADWSTGDGPEVSGPAISLLLVMTGRAAALKDLTGDGLATLAARTPGS